MVSKDDDSVLCLRGLPDSGLVAPANAKARCFIITERTTVAKRVWGADALAGKVESDMFVASDGDRDVDDLDARIDGETAVVGEFIGDPGPDKGDCRPDSFPFTGRVYRST